VKQQTFSRVVDIVTSRRGRLALLLCAVVLVSLQMVMLQRVGHIVGPGYTSDDVAQQTIISQWQRGFRDPAVIGDDNWFIKYPLYWAANEIPWSPEVRAFTTSWILTITTVVGSIMVLWLIADRTRLPGKSTRLLQVLLPVVTITALSPLAIYLMSRINTRNIEIPLLLLLLYGLILHDRGRLKRPLALAAGATVLIGILLANDPMFRFMVIVPVVVVFAFRAALGVEPLRHWAPIAGIVAGGWVIAAIIKKLLLKLLPMTFAIHPQDLTSFTGFVGHITILLSNDLDLFNADFWSRTVGAGTGVRLINALLLAVGLIAAWRLVKLSLTDRTVGASIQIIGLLPFWIIGVVLVSDFDADVRYLILVPFMLSIAIVIAVARSLIKPRLAAVIAALLVFSALSNAAVAARQLSIHPSDQANADEQAVVTILHQQHLTKGYATYWHANIVSFLSGYSADVISIDCNTTTQQVSFDPILSETGVVRKPATSSFVLYYPVSQGGHEECDLPTITKQFGPPDEVVAVPAAAGGTLAIYHHDITNRLYR
jgi:hypothetical protein